MHKLVSTLGLFCVSEQPDASGGIVVEEQVPWSTQVAATQGIPGPLSMVTLVDLTLEVAPLGPLGMGRK